MLYFKNILYCSKKHFWKTARIYSTFYYIKNCLFCSFSLNGYLFCLNFSEWNLLKLFLLENWKQNVNNSLTKCKSFTVINHDFLRAYISIYSKAFCKYANLLIKAASWINTKSFIRTFSFECIMLHRI